MYFIYDGTYPGFLTAVYEIYHFGTGKLEDIRRDDGESTLFGMTYLVDTRFLKAEKVAAAFEKKCGKKALRWMYRAFLSNFEGKDMKIFLFIKEGFKLGKGIYTRQKEPWVQDILSMCRAVGNETEKFRGILRFSELEARSMQSSGRIMPSCPCWLPISRTGCQENAGLYTTSGAGKRRSTQRAVFPSYR